MAAINKKAAGMAAVGVAAAAIGLGVSAAARADSTTPTPSPTTTSQSGTATPKDKDAHGPGHGWGPGGKHGGFGGLKVRGTDVATLSTSLGVDETTLRDALKAVRDELRQAAKAGTPPTATDRATMRDQLATKLAGKLGIDAAKVKKAFADLEAAEQAEHQKAFDDRLAQAVKDGRLTQAEADAVKKAAKAGVIGLGHGRH